MSHVRDGLVDEVALRAWKAVEEWCGVPISAARFPVIRGVVADFLGGALAPLSEDEWEQREVDLAGRIMCAIGDDLAGARLLLPLTQTVPMAIHAALLSHLHAAAAARSGEAVG